MSIDVMLSLLFQVGIVAAICWLLWWGIGAIGIPEPFNKILRGIVIVFAVFFLIQLLLSMAGHPLGVVPLRVR